MVRLMLGKIIIVVFTTCALAAFAEPNLSVIRIQPRFPWNNGVDIDYEISGRAGRAEEYLVRFAVSAKTNGVPVSLTANWFVSQAACDLPVSNGINRVTWDPVKEGLSGELTDVAVRATLVHAPVLPSKAQFMILDLSSGASGPYTVRYVASNRVAGVQFAACNRYRETHLVLARIPAQTFWAGGVFGGNATEAGVRNYVKNWLGITTEPALSAKMYTFRRLVTISRDYWMGVFPVTMRQYELVVGGVPEYAPKTDPDYLRSPVNTVTWNTLTASNGFLALVGSRARYHDRPVTGFDLPTEAQWECAARAGCPESYHWGVSNTGFENPDVGQPSALAYEWTSDSDSKYHAVGLKLPNAYGLFDLYKNGCDFCKDWQAAYPTNVFDGAGAIIPLVDPQGPDAGTKKVLCGSWWNDVAKNGRDIGSSHRLAVEPATVWYSGQLAVGFGFRLCCLAD